VKRPILIAAAGAFERSALRRILSDAFPSAALRDCRSQADLMQELADRFAGLVVLDDALARAEPQSGPLGNALQRLGPRLIRLPRDTAMAGPPVGTWARDLPGLVSHALAAHARPDHLGARPPASVAEDTGPSMPLAAQTGRNHGPLEDPQCLLVASSTGGPGALAQLLKTAPPDALPWVIAQHMPADGTAAFAAHLSDVSGRKVSEVSSQTRIEAGGIHVLRGGQDFELVRTPAGAVAVRPSALTPSPFHPNADRLMQSAAEANIPAMALVLSGMGEDGARGALALAAAGSPVYVQEPATCVVPGMPGAALERVPAAVRLDPSQPPPSFMRLCSLRPGRE
jgi:chemotaxis response regulator CheB